MQNFNQINHVFFIGVAGTGMSALAQYCKGIGKQVSGSDRYFGNQNNNETQTQLEAYGITCFEQNGSGITTQTELVIVSTAVEETNAEYQKALQLNIPIIKRSQLLSLICTTKKTIAIGGTSGKSTTAAMLFDILDYAGLEPSIISGAGLVRLQKQGLIGNAWVGKGDWLVIEADESDGSIVYYTPEIGVLLNVDKDHKEVDELIDIFTTFKNNSNYFFVNNDCAVASKLSQNPQHSFAVNATAGYTIKNVSEQGLYINFTINNEPFTLNTFGIHNAQNALAATAVAQFCGVNLSVSAKALQQYQGIYRRNQIIHQSEQLIIIDDYAHNPAKCAAAIKGVQSIAQQAICWFQPHGYGPTKFLRADFVHEISQALRSTDSIYMSEIFYAGGTAVKDISASDLINDLQHKGGQAYFVADRNKLADNIASTINHQKIVILLMGARDPSLANFAQEFCQQLLALKK